MAKLGISVRSNARQIIAQAKADGLTRAHQRRSAARALNRAGEGARTEATRKIAERYRIKRALALEAISIQKATPENLVVRLTVRGRPFSLARFDPRVRKGGVVTVNVKGSRKVVKGGFARTLSSRNGLYQVIFKREGDARYPLKALKTVDMPGVFSREEVQQHLEQAANERFDREFVRQLDLALTKQQG